MKNNLQVTLAAPMATLMLLSNAFSFGAHAIKANAPIETLKPATIEAIELQENWVALAPAQEVILEKAVRAPETAPMTASETASETAELVIPLTEEMIVLAKTLYGEARGQSVKDQAAVIWCILNRADSGYADGTPLGVATQPNQFYGYKTHHPVEEEQLAIVYDVLSRWELQKEWNLSDAEVGRTLPSGYHDFRARQQGNGKWRNEFMVCFSRNSAVWDWSYGDPYDGIVPELPDELEF